MSNKIRATVRVTGFTGSGRGKLLDEIRGFLAKKYKVMECGDRTEEEYELDILY